MTFFKNYHSLLILATVFLPRIESKILPKCELARELEETFKFPKEDIPKWLCLVHWESDFDMAALNKGAIPNSFDHGIFQINDFNWCKSPSRPSENRCKVPCESLRDDDISDDVQCLRVIMQQRGFDEWMSHPLRCSENTDQYLEDCQLTKRDLKLGVKFYPDYPKYKNMKLRIGLTSDPKGLKMRLFAPESRLNFISKIFSGHTRFKPFFSMHQYITK